MALEEEREFYLSRKAELLQHHKDQFALIKGRTFVGAFTTAEEAFKEGVRRFGNQPFLIQQVKEQDDIVQHPALSVGVISVNS